MSSRAENPSAGRTRSCPYTSASPGTSPRKSRTASLISFKSTPPLSTAQIPASRGFQRFRPPFIRTLMKPNIAQQVSLENMHDFSSLLDYGELYCEIFNDNLSAEAK